MYFDICRKSSFITFANSVWTTPLRSGSFMGWWTLSWHKHKHKYKNSESKTNANAYAEKGRPFLAHKLLMRDFRAHDIGRKKNLPFGHLNDCKFR